MKKILYLIIFMACTSYSPKKEVLNYDEQLIKIESNLDEADKALDNVSVIISDDKRLKKIQKNIKKHN